MNIIINNAESTKEVLNEVQKHVRTNPIAYENIVCAIRVVENKLRDVSNKDKAGCRFVCDIHSNPHNKNHLSTWFVAEHDGEGWNVTNIYRNKCAIDGRTTHLYLTEKAEQRVMRGLTDF